MPESPVEMRRATRDDLPAIIALLADDDIGAQRESAGPLLPEYERAFAAIDANADELLVVACIDGDVVGTLQLTLLHHLSHRGSVRAQIESVRVAGALRGRGVGHQLLEWTLAYARERGARLAQLSTDKSRVDARRFYESLGFHATHEGMKLALGEP
jgi:ribosomal protein S18 acetylase RimI-like enzyme